MIARLLFLVSRSMCMRVLIAGVVTFCTVVPAVSGIIYFQGWDTPGNLGGWIPNTTETSITVVDTGGNPNGYLHTFGDITPSFAVGAVGDFPPLTGNYAAAGLNQVSFDLLFLSGSFSEAAFRVRFMDASHNGWRFPLTTDFAPGVWHSFVINFDPTWSDTQALAAGWIQEPFSPSFSETMANVFAPEVRLSGLGHLDAGIDNFTASTVSFLQAELAITKTDGVTTAVPGTTTTYTIAVSNGGPSAVTGAVVTDTLPAAITGATWTCVASAGSACGAASGTGSIATTVNLLVGGTATFTVVASIAPSATGSLVNTASVAAPAGVTDPTPGNNTATDTDTLTPNAAIPTLSGWGMLLLVTLLVGIAIMMLRPRAFRL